MTALELVELSREECLALLADGDFGRVAITIGLGLAPIIRPVGYRFDVPSQSIVFRTLEGSKLRALSRARRASFEIDGHDRDGRSGWSVIVLGIAEPVTHAAEIDRLARLAVAGWPELTGARWMRIRARTVSGRRLVPVADAA